MESPVVFRSVLRAPAAYRTLLHAPSRPHIRTSISPLPPQNRHITIPRIITPSFWISMIPKPLRPSSFASPAEAASETASDAAPTPTTPTSRREWNPATPYIILALLVGSQAIQILWLKRDREHFLLRSEAKIGVLREVIERVQKGESVDVEGVLGSGDEVREKEWGDVMKEIEREEVLYRSKKRRRAMREELEAAEKAAEVETSKGAEEAVKKGVEEGKGELFKGARFY